MKIDFEIHEDDIQILVKQRIQQIITDIVDSEINVSLDRYTLHMDIDKEVQKQRDKFKDTIRAKMKAAGIISAIQ